MTNTMPVLTECERKELIDEIDYNRKNCFLSSKTKLLMQIAEAALTAPAVADVVAWNHPNEERTCSVNLRDFNLQPGPLFTAPPVPSLKLPDAIEPEDVPGLIDSTANPDEYACCVGKDAWDACIAEVKKLNGVTE